MDNYRDDQFLTFRTKPAISGQPQGRSMYLTPIKWRGWIQNCLNSSKGSILVNGSPTEEFQFYKVLKQVDDAIFLGQWNDSNIDTLVHVMECFYRVSGLRINLYKSKIMVGENMSRVHAWKEVIVKIKSRLSNWKLKTLSIGGRFTLLKSVLVSTPIFHMSIYKVPLSVLHLLESIRSHFFHGHDPRSKKASWVNWNKVLTAKERGGLEVSSLYALNRGLMCKWVWRFFAHKSLLWSRVIKAIHGPEGGLMEMIMVLLRFQGNFKMSEIPTLLCINLKCPMEEIVKVGLNKVPLGGSAYTWCHKSASKMSKLDRFLVSENLLNTCPNISAITLDRFLSDHRLILLHSWKDAPGDDSNAMRNLCGKLKFLKVKIRAWYADYRNNSKGSVTNFKEELRILDELIDKGNGSDEIVNNPLEILTDNPKAVKQEFFQHFRNRFDKPPDQNAHIDMPFPNSLSTDHQKTLECKNPDANMVKDFRPISLIGSIYKIIAKILTNRLVGVLGDIVNEVQSAFISERQILDGPFILNEIMQWCRRRKKQSLIFKVDFEKAYDSVRWDFLDDILVKFGFGIKWRGWIQNCLNSSKGSILVNGSPTEEFQFYKGLKQGDPLSPFLFILVMESLHISFQRVVDVGMFTGIKLSSSLNISHLFYADDAIFLGQWNDSNIDTLVHVMECFYRVSGLRINLCKSKIMGIHVDADRIKSAASKLGCLVLNTPFLYLGTKVGENMSRVHAWKEVIVKIKSRLSNWKLKTLSIGGRFTLLKSVLGSTPIFHMSIYKVPSSVLHLLESIRSHFFHGHDPRSKKASWVNWNKVLTAKERGGLGVSSLYALNRGLMCKWVWRFFAHKSLLWSRVIKAIHGPEGGLITDVRRGFRSTWTSIVQEVKKLQNQGVNIFDYIRIKIGNGDNTSFWKDKWHNEGVLKDVFPRLYALERHQNVTIHTKLIDYSLVNSFRRNPRSGVEEFQLDNLSRLVSTITLSSAVDRYVWSLENSGEFSVKSIRQVIDANCFPVIHSATRWVKSVPLKVNIMAWKIKMDGLPTRMNISRRGIEIDSIVCPICNSGAESSCHIFFQCNLVRQLARKISSWWNVDYVDVSSYEEWYTWLVSLRLQANLKAVFEGIFYCLWWSVWMFRNKILFEKDTPSHARIFDNIVSNSYYWCKFRCKASFKWIDWLKNPYLVIV
ncbi:RNA-directed DNA polymerase, eukaryota, reverse transcriptase zinc-binding domain protein [Tanacetum coccineum]